MQGGREGKGRGGAIGLSQEGKGQLLRRKKKLVVIYGRGKGERKRAAREEEKGDHQDDGAHYDGGGRAVASLARLVCLMMAEKVEPGVPASSKP